MNEYELINNEWEGGDYVSVFESVFDTNVSLILARIKALKPEDCGVIDE